MPDSTTPDSTTNESTMPAIRELGLEAAREIAGPNAVDDVQVVEELDAEGSPAYRFDFLIDPAYIQLRPGLVRIRLGQRLRRDLTARGDAHRPLLRMLDRADWSRRLDA